MSFAPKVSVPVYFTLSSTWKRCLERKEAIKTLDVKSNFPFVSQKMQVLAIEKKKFADY